MTKEGEENNIMRMWSLRWNSCLFFTPAMEEMSTPKGCITFTPQPPCWGGFVASQRPALQDKAAILGACQLQWWSNKICQRRKHTTPSRSCCSCFLFSISACPLGHWLTQKATQGDIRVSIWHCPPGVMYMKAYGTALLLDSKHRKNFTLVTLLVFHMVPNYPWMWIICIQFTSKIFSRYKGMSCLYKIQ